MKKVIIGLFAALSFAGAKAQESNVLSAWEYMNVYTLEKQNGNMGVAIDNLIKAKEAIDAAALDEKTKGKSKTWKRRADVYLKIMVEKDPAIAPYKKGVVDEIYTSIEKARTVEVNEKTGKPKIFEENELLNSAYYICDTLFRSGSANYVSGDYTEAGKFFEKRYTLLKGLGRIDTVSYTNMFLSAYKGKDYERATTIGEDLIKLGSADPNLYGTMATIYNQKGEGAKGLQIIKDARAKYPKNTEFITEELNYYLTTGDNANAVRVMDEAIAAFQTKPEMLKTLYFNSGVIYSQLGDKTKSREYYDKALAIDPKYFGALNNVAAMLLDEANAIIKEANGLPLNESKKFDELTAKAKGIYAQAGTYLETAYEAMQENIAKGDKNQASYEKQAEKLKISLVEIFSKLENEEKVMKYSK